MAKFCTKCGKPLKDGKPCDCEKESVSNDNVVGDYLDILKGMFKNPSKVLKNEADEKNLTFSLGSIVVNAIIFGLTINFLLNNIFAKAGLDLSSITDSIGSIANQLSSFGVNMSSIVFIAEKVNNIIINAFNAVFILFSLIYISNSIAVANIETV